MMIRVIAVVLLAHLLVGASAFAEETSTPPPPSIRASIARLRIEPHDRYPFQAMQRPSRRNGTAQKVTAGFAMGVLGLIGGAYLGSRLEGNCRCDDPGLSGAMVGAPIGAILGAIAGVWLASR
jgi:hypothetical protein